MRDYCSYADVFLGCDEIALPEPEGVAAHWQFIKGLCGNTHPGAALPFGRITCGCYSGAYSAGYGRNMGNTGEKIRKLYDRNKFIGLSHFHHSGTGWIGMFYNYLVTSPFYGSASDAFEPSDILNERGCPGYYACYSSRGVYAECTVTPGLALHRYTFDKEGGRIAVDVSNNGLARRTTAFHRPSDGSVRVLSDSEALCEVVQEGIRIYARIRCIGAEKCSIWQGTEEGSFAFDPDVPFGVVFDAAGQRAEVQISIGCREQESFEPADFDRACSEAYSCWNRALGAIDVQGSPKDMSIFYSNFYHTLAKPCDWTGEGLFGSGDRPFMGDLATMWDMYKTQLPLVFTLFGDIRRKVLDSFLIYQRFRGGFPHCLLMTDDPWIEDKQARALAEHSILDAFYRTDTSDGTLDGIDLRELAEACDRDMYRPGREDFTEKGFCPRATHILDMAEAAGCTATLARAAGLEEIALRQEALHEYWRNAFGPDGLMRQDSEYYEGNYYSYSFRLMQAMDERIALCGGKEQFAAYLDEFFGFDKPGDHTNRFQGFNNETDMEAPYAYHYAGRRDRLCRIIDGCLDYMFVQGRGGIPGNNDSGGLSATYMWNAMGLFPVTGQDKYILGKCRFRRVTLRLSSGNSLEIINRCGRKDPEKATFNGVQVTDWELSARSVMSGGTLVFE